MKLLMYLLGAAVGWFPASAWAAGDAARGQQLYAAQCIACHSVDVSMAGPAHRGVVGRKAGAVADFDYSPALRRSGVVWNAKTLYRWLANPEAFIPGQKMNYAVADPQARADLIAFLKSVSPATPRSADQKRR